MELVNIVPGRLMRRPVDRHPVPHLILNNQHPQLFKLFSKVFDVKAYNPVIQFHIGTVIEYF